MENTLPLVSIITPSYNQGRFIEDAILSVKNQDYLNIEHLIIDGGSKDQTLMILKNYECMYNMHWISESDNGQSDAINKGFGKAKGEIIGWINSDDAYFDVKTISTIVNYFYKFDDINVIYGDAVRIDENNLIQFVMKNRKFNRNYLKQTCFLVQPAVFFRRKIIDKYKLDINLQIAMDYDFWLRISKFNDFKYINKIFAVDRAHKERKIISRWSEMIKESQIVSKEYGDIPEPDKIIGYYKYFNRKISELCAVWSLYRDYNFAFGLKLDPIKMTIVRQIKS